LQQNAKTPPNSTADGENDEAATPSTPEIARDYIDCDYCESPHRGNKGRANPGGAALVHGVRTKKKMKKKKKKEGRMKKRRWKRREGPRALSTFASAAIPL
jgi:hypothetical protein